MLDSSARRDLTDEEQSKAKQRGKKMKGSQKMHKKCQQGKFTRIVNRPQMALEGYETTTDCKKIATLVNRIASKRLFKLSKSQQKKSWM